MLTVKLFGVGPAMAITLVPAAAPYGLSLGPAMPSSAIPQVLFNCCLVISAKRMAMASVMGRNPATEDLSICSHSRRAGSE